MTTIIIRSEMLPSYCNGLCDRYRDLWKPKPAKMQQRRYHDGAMFCRRCAIRIASEYALEEAHNRCPCCHYLMRSKRASKLALAKHLGYDPRDRKRI